MNLPSQLLEQAVEEFAKLPGVGKKTALRYVLHLLKQSPDELQKWSATINRLSEEIHYCEVCFAISEQTKCEICSNESRDHSTICVVEDIRDLIAIENTSQYRGTYHVLGGIISPINGIGPMDITIEPLLKRIEANAIKEVILALPSTMEGDTTNFYLNKKLSPFKLSISALARGVPVGDELEYTDEVTLGQSIILRVPYESSYIRK
ncbi:MAG TPA: recombination mediator RecR [Bacteroidia bacterium]|jgi:recombination protein RecR|nr:recombination mediator RecR [Bacteroidia bacterium]